MIDEKFNKVVAYLENGIEPVQRMGLKVVECGERHVKLMMPLDRNKNHFGTLYAGAQFTLSDIAAGALFGVSFDYYKYYPLVKELTTKFLKAAIGDLYTELEFSKEQVEHMKAEAELNGKANYSLDMDLKDVTGQVISRIHGEFQIRKISSDLRLGW